MVCTWMGDRLFVNGRLYRLTSGITQKPRKIVPLHTLILHRECSSLSDAICRMPVIFAFFGCDKFNCRIVARFSGRELPPPSRVFIFDSIKGGSKTFYTMFVRSNWYETIFETIFRYSVIASSSESVPLNDECSDSISSFSAMFFR